MIQYVCLVALVNLVLGLGLGAFLGRRYRALRDAANRRRADSLSALAAALAEIEAAAQPVAEHVFAPAEPPPAEPEAPPASAAEDYVAAAAMFQELAAAE